MKHLIFTLAAILALASCSNAVTISREEASLINDSPEVMRILTIESEDDLAVLRRTSSDFNEADLKTAEYASLARKLISTLQSTDGGVGLAAPQVGINRRAVAVQRFDKEGEPIEVYPNIRIVDVRGEMAPGPEGCLSIPDERGEVLRYQDITIEYSDMGKLVREDVSGFTAVIFQHETDHLEGILYIDRKL